MASRKVKLNMEGVESYTRCPEGEWVAKVKKIEMGEVQGSGDDCLKAQMEVIKGDAKGCIVYETFSLAEKALWKLKGFLEAVGAQSKGKFTLDLDKLEGKTCIIEVIHDEYNGTKRAKISNYLKLNAADEEDDEEEEDEEEDEEEEEKPAPKKSSKTAKKSSKKVKEPEEDEDEEDEEDDEEEEEEKPAPKKSKKSSKPAPKKSAKKVAKEEEDDEDDWEEDDD